MYFSPDNGCLQYHTGITGRFETFNYPATSESHLPSQQLVVIFFVTFLRIWMKHYIITPAECGIVHVYFRYSVCIRQEEGYCCVQYVVSQIGAIW